MSGGYFEYQQYKINQIADQVEQLIISNDDKSQNQWGYPSGRGFDADVIEKFKEGLAALKVAAVYAQRIDWLVSDDDGPESFLARLASDLKDAAS